MLMGTLRMTPAIETGVTYGIITDQNSMFLPDKIVSRSEAYKMIMTAVCLKPADNDPNWQETIWSMAHEHNLTNREWSDFEPNSPILRQEIFKIASYASDWAEKTGGCNPKPKKCLTQ